MAVQSIGTAVEEGDITGDHLFMTAGQVAVRKMDLEREIHQAGQEIGARTKTFNNAWDQACCGTDELVSSSQVPGGLMFFNNPDLGLDCNGFCVPYFGNTSIVGIHSATPVSRQFK